MENFFVYMLRCFDGSYYVGHTDDLEKRLAEHQAGVRKCYTAKRLPVALVYQATFFSRDEALAAEQKIKGWSKSKKEVLLKTDWQLVSALSKRGHMIGTAVQTLRGSRD